MKKYKLNNSGFGTLLGITITLILSLSLTFFLLKLKTENNEFKYRYETYSCVNTFIKLNTNFVNAISKSNISIIALNLTSATGVLSAQSLQLMQLIKLAQQALNLKIIKDISQTKNCTPFEIKSMLANLPYERESLITLKRNLDQTIALKDNEWNLKIGHIQSGVRIKKLFLISLHLNLLSNLDGILKLKIKELKIPAL